MSEKTRAELKEQIKITNHNYQAIREMHERGYQYSVGEIKRLQDELERTRKALDVAKKENEDKQAVLNCVVDMFKTLNQKYTLIMGKDVIKETVRLLEQNKGGDNE